MHKCKGFSQDNELFGAVCQIFCAIRGKPNHILDADAEAALQVDAGFHGDDHALLGGGLRGDGGRKAGHFVDLDADGMAQAVAEAALIAGIVDELTGGGIHGAAGSAHDLFEAVTSRSEEQDIIIKAAAVADYRPAVVSDEKVKKSDGDLSLALERTEDTLSYLGTHKRPGQLLCGFAMETSQLEERARGKLERKNLDLIAANNLKVAGAGFGTDTNVITLIDKQQTRHLEQMSKEAAAMEILTVLRDMMK